jgi:hypothetical protein
LTCRWIFLIEEAGLAIGLRILYGFLNIFSICMENLALIFHKSGEFRYKTRSRDGFDANMRGTVEIYKATDK